jgi:tRNA-dihydrouridine synthase B
MTQQIHPQVNSQKASDMTHTTIPQFIPSSTEKSFVYMSAPLEDNSDNAYRTLCHKYGADITYTEMIRCAGLVKHNKSTWSRLEHYDSTPTIVQLMCAKETELEQFLKEFKPWNGFVGFNFNMGCPSPHVIRLGLGCAFLKRIAKAQRFVDIVKKYGYAVSIKMRLGMNGYEKEKQAYLNIIRQVSADFFIVHLRHGKQTYADPADYAVLPQILATGKKIIVNGDIQTSQQIQTIQQMGASGVMIGRAAVYNPAIFQVLKGEIQPSFDEIRATYLQLCQAYATKPLYERNISSRIGKQKSVLLSEFKTDLG